MQGSELHVSVAQTPNIQHRAIINNTCLNYVKLENVGHFMLLLTYRGVGRLKIIGGHSTTGSQSLGYLINSQ